MDPLDPKPSPNIFQNPICPKSQKFSELDIGGREIYSTLNFIKKWLLISLRINEKANDENDAVWNDSHSLRSTHKKH